VQKKPELKNKIHTIYVMGNAVSTKNNASQSEWNIYLDPETAKKIFHANIPTVVVPLNAAYPMPIDKDFYNQI